MTVQAAAARETAALGEWVAALAWADVPASVSRRLRLVLVDLLGVAALGAQDPDQRRLVRAWDLLPGPAPVMGAGATTSVEAAAALNATALVRLELDEGNKYARGHPAAHGFPAVLALASALDAPGPDLLAALLAAYEVASRFGRATQLHAGLHPHGSWGVPGAAAGCARLLGLGPAATAAAIDAGSGMPVAAHFASALDGNRVRDSWVSAANLSGLCAARMARAGLASNTGTAARTLGEILGSFDPAELTAGLGQRWDVQLGYFKQHAACSFTHPAADAVLALRASGSLADPDRVDEVTVETHSLALGLDRTTWENRLSAMFSIPFVVATALVHGSVGPEASSERALADPRVRSLAQRVRVVPAADLDARLPAERGVRVRVLSGSGELVAERPNPVGDSDFHPLDEHRVVELLTRLLGDEGAVRQIVAVADGLADEPAAAGLLATLAAGPQRPDQAADH